MICRKRRRSGSPPKSDIISQSAAEQASTKPLSSPEIESKNAPECLTRCSMADKRKQDSSIEGLFGSEPEHIQSSSPVQRLGDEREDHQPREYRPFVDVYDGSSPKSEDSCSSQAPSPPSCSLLLVARARHQVVTPVMKEVYAMLAPKGGAALKQYAKSGHENSAAAHKAELELHHRGERKIGKRCKRLDDSSANEEEEDDQNKRQKHPSSKVASGDTQLPYACPFHKYDPFKYRPTTDAGPRYRTCVGPGFKCISRLK